MIDVKDFQTDVLDASHEKPVLVDFWADWCQPCHMLTPILEKLAYDDNEAHWSLAKVNVDQHQLPAQTYRVMSLPTVMIFYNGEPTGQFKGVLPEVQVKDFIEQHIPREGRNVEERLAEVRKLIQNDQFEYARVLAEQLWEAYPADTRVTALFAQLTALKSPGHALELAGRIPAADPQAMSAEHARVLAHMKQMVLEDHELPEDAVRPIYREALEAFHRWDVRSAIEGLLKVVQQNKAYHEEGARVALIALFDLLGKDHALTQTYRRRFDMALY